MSSNFYLGSISSGRLQIHYPKKGKGDEFKHYRGITLLSVAYKAYAMILEMRLRTWCERNGVLVDEQLLHSIHATALRSLRKDLIVSFSM